MNESYGPTLLQDLKKGGYAGNFYGNSDSSRVLIIHDISYKTLGEITADIEIIEKKTGKPISRRPELLSALLPYLRIPKEEVNLF
jgi:hypothetical protein